jgi:hypothetical protein
MEGRVAEVLVGGNFRIEIQGGHSVLAQLGRTPAAKPHPRRARGLGDGLGVAV